MPLIQAQKDIRILIDEDHNVDEISEDFIGRKAYSLFKLRDMDVPVPPFFAVSSSVFTEYVKDTLGTSINKKTSDDDIRDLILEGDFTLQLRNEIMEGYSRLSGFTDTWVAVRSSAVFPATHRHLTFAGLLDTVLNVKGLDNILTAIQTVYASLFTSKVLGYLSDFNLNISDIKVAIVIQKMVQAEASGIVFTVDPISQDNNYLTIEAVFGLGDVIAKGDITPDQYIIDKKTLEFKEKRILPQEWMMVRNLKKKEDGQTDQKVQISKSWQHQQKLENRYISELSKIAAVVEKKAGEAQDIEWVFEGGRLWLLQSTAVQHIELPRTIQEEEIEISPAIVSAAQEIAQKEELRQNVKKAVTEKKEPETEVEIPPVEQAVTVSEPQMFTEKPLSRQVLQGVRHTDDLPKSDTMQPVTHISPLPGERLFLTGVGASPQSMRGTVLVIENSTDISPRQKVTAETVIVIPEHLDGIDNLLNKVGAVIVDTGGMTSDIATVCRERRVPCIMGTHIASRMLKTGENVLVDGTIGAVYGIRDITADYRSSIQQSSSPSDKNASSEISSTPTAETTDQSPISVPEPVKSKIKTATKLFLNAPDAKSAAALTDALSYSDGVCTIPIESFYSSSSIGKHPEALIEDGKRTELIESLQKEISAYAELTQDRPIILSIGSMTVGEYKALTRGSTYEDIDQPDFTKSTRGLVRLLNHPKEVGVILKAIRKVRNVDGWRTVSLAIDYAATPKHVAEFKKLLTTAGIRRSATFKLFLTISTPSEAMIVDEFIKNGIDGIIIDAPRLAQHMMALTPDDSSVVKVIETIKEASANIQTVLILSKENRSLLKQAFKMGFYGFSTGPSELESTREKVAEYEVSLIFRR